MAQHVPGRIVRPIGGILHKGDAVFHGVGRQLRPGHTQQRTQDTVPLFRNASQPFQARAPQQI